MNALGFQIIWFVCALTLSDPHIWSYILVVSLTFFFALHHILNCDDPILEIGLIVQITLLGWLMDTLLSSNGYISFNAPYPEPLSSLQPFWMTCLWVALGCTLNSSLSWIQLIPKFTPLLGLIAGTLSYLAGERFGVLRFVSEWSIIVTSCCWAIVMPLAMMLSRKNLKN